MATLQEQVDTLENSVISLRALVNGVRDKGLWYALVGDHVLYGCKITQGASATDLYLALEGQEAGDSFHLNPDIQDPALRHEEYPNIALIYGEVFESEDINDASNDDDNLLLDDASGSVGYGRNDIVYLYVSKSGPAFAIQTGTNSTACFDDFTNNGLDTKAYPSTYDATIPHGAMAVARVHVRYGDTGIADARIADLRNFTPRYVESSSTDLRYKFSTTTTDADPGVGFLRLNNAAVASATAMYIDDSELGGTDVQAFLRVFDDSTSIINGYIVIRYLDNNNKFAIFSTSSLTEDTGYFDIVITYITGNITSILANQKLTLSFIRAGDKGDTGSFGGSSFSYRFNTDTVDNDPGAGLIKANNADLSLATQLNIDDLDYPGTDISTYLLTCDDSTSTVKGHIKIINTNTPSEYVIYTLSSLADQAGYVAMTVAYIDGSVTTFTNNSDIIFTFTRTGDKGQQGNPGSLGFHYKFNTDTVDNDPGAGLIKANNADLSLATQLNIDDLDTNAVDLQTFWPIIDDSTSTVKGHIIISGKTNPENFVIYSISALSDQAGYFTATATYIDGSVTTFTNNSDIIITFSRTGDKGLTGNTGLTGGFNLDYQFNTDTADTDPGNGLLKFNNADLSLATQLNIDDLDDNGTDVQAFLRVVDDSTSVLKGHFRLFSRTTPANFVTFSFSSAITEAAGYFTLPCTYITGSVTSFSNNEEVAISFIRTGDAGTGDVNGPGSSVDDNIVIFNGTGGKTIQDSGIAINKIQEALVVAWFN